MKKKETSHAKYVAASDAAIAEAYAQLMSSERGRAVLGRFKEMTAPASGLDAPGMQALAILTMEFGGGRREFLNNIARRTPGEFGSVDPRCPLCHGTGYTTGTSLCSCLKNPDPFALNDRLGQAVQLLRKLEVDCGDEDGGELTAIRELVEMAAVRFSKTLN